MVKVELMSAQQAIDLMRSSIDVFDWNQKRQIVKYNVSKSIRHQILVLIDCYGLCSKVAKENKWPHYLSRNISRAVNQMITESKEGEQNDA
jgi:hypothetical protein